MGNSTSTNNTKNSTTSNQHNKPMEENEQNINSDVLISNSTSENEEQTKVDAARLSIVDNNNLNKDDLESEGQSEKRTSQRNEDEVFKTCILEEEQQNCHDETLVLLTGEIIATAVTEVQAYDQPTNQRTILREEKKTNNFGEDQNEQELEQIKQTTQNENLQVTYNEHPTRYKHKQLSMDIYRQCPICFESAYKCPKLLPCGHTFCSPCLKDHVRNKISDESVICPMCRSNIHIPGDGVRGFQENYFVTAENVLTCDVCRENVSEWLCGECDKRMCVICRKSHKCKKSASKGPRNLFSLSTFGDSSDTDSDSSSHSVRSDASLPWSFTQPNAPWTKILLTEHAHFKLEEDICCNGIIPVSTTEAWLFKTNEELETCSFGLYNINGDMLRNVDIQPSASGFAVEQTNSILVSFAQETVVRRFTGSEPTIIIPPSIFHPIGIAIFPDDSVVIAGFEKDNIADVVLGCVKCFMPAGEEIWTFTTGYDIVPMRVCVLGNDLICLSYLENHFVDVRLKDGNVVGKYNGNDPDDDESFTPVDLCIGSYSNRPVVLVTDNYSDSIHMISYAAEFVGLVLRSPVSGSSGLGEPGAIGSDSDGKLWVGQRENNEISIYNVCKYSNVMQ
ncbi:unnamed protein product [Mytilus coruscus]|uniref:RING-type domain-containing protein n=1 Tax=Mytilus coruscus TaxID=42192 RepID=A0A6J8AP56_MYTCO|nr:unnamed protein product [Mytilus coruscus]